METINPPEENREVAFRLHMNRILDHQSKSRFDYDPIIFI